MATNNSSRLEYAVQQLEASGLEFKVMNRVTGQIIVHRMTDDETFVFYANTGRTTGHPEISGIRALICACRTVPPGATHAENDDISKAAKTLCRAMDVRGGCDACPFSCDCSPRVNGFEAVLRG